MSVSESLPSVLHIPSNNPANPRSLSVSRVLKQALDMLDLADFPDDVDEEDFQVVRGNLEILLHHVR